jgi:integrase
MGNIRVRKETGLLYFDFFFHSIRCREQTRLSDTASNRKRLVKILQQIEKEIDTGVFSYAQYFPGSRNIEKIAAIETARQQHQALPAEAGPHRAATRAQSGMTPLFECFSQDWFLENEVRWKRSYRKTVRGNLDKHLIAEFGKKEVGSIDKGEILRFRSTLAKVRNGSKEGLSPDRINHIMTTLRMILEDAADRFDFTTPFARIKPLKVIRSDVDPFSIEEVTRFLKFIRPDYRDYYTVRFFTGMRTGEIDGLKWEYVDFDRRLIRIRETLVDGQADVTKTPASIREICMSEPVFQALQRQYQVSASCGSYVFSNREGQPLDHRNITKRIWYPSLRMMGIKPRKPYQTRHTAATLWLAAGENPEWIARQMGHTTTRMLFTVYSRFVPNLTRRDGSAFENLLAARLPGVIKDPSEIAASQLSDVVGGADHV